MKSISRTDLIKGNRDLKMELDIAFDKVKIGLNEKSIDMMNTEYNTVYDFSCVKSCSGDFSGRAVRTQKDFFNCEKPTIEIDNQCQICFKEYLHVHCSMCDRSKKQSSIKLLSDEEIKSLKDNILNDFDQRRNIMQSQNMQSILLAKDILSKLYRMNVDRVEDPYKMQINPLVCVDIATKIYSKIKYLDRSIFEIPTINVIKDTSVLVRENSEFVMKKSKGMKSISEISIQDHEALIESFDDVFSMKQIQKLVNISFENGLILSDILSEIRSAEQEQPKSQIRNTKLEEKRIAQINNTKLNKANKELAEQELHKSNMKNDELYAIRNNNIDNPMKTQRLTDIFLAENPNHYEGKIGQLINKYFDNLEILIRAERIKEQNKTSEINLDILGLESIISHYLKQPNYEIGQKQIPSLREDLELAQEYKECLIAGIN